MLCVILGSRLPWKDFLRKYDEYSLKNWLIKASNLSYSSVALTGIFNNIEPFSNSGLVEIILDDCVYSGTHNEFDYVVGGFDLIPRGFLPELSEDIVLRAKVSDIRQSKDGVSVT